MLEVSQLEAVSVWRIKEEKIKKDIKSVLNSKQVPKSHFINESEMRLIIKDCFENWKEEQELFGIDTTKYWVV